MEPDTPNIPPAPDAPEPSAEAAPPRAWWRTLLKAAGLGVLGLVVLIVVFVLALQTNWGGSRFGNFLLGLGNPFDATVTEYDALGGNFVNRLALYNLRMTRLDTVRYEGYRIDTLALDPVRVDTVRFDTVRVDSLRLMQIDTFQVRYNLLALLKGEVHLNELTFAGPDLTARQRADSSWDLLDAFPQDTTQKEGLFSFHIERTRLTRGTLSAFYLPVGEEAGGVMQVQEAHLEASDLHVGGGAALSVALDSLAAHYRLPGQEGFARLHGSGRMRDNRLALRHLRLRSDRSDLTAHGGLYLALEQVVDDAPPRPDARSGHDSEVAPIEDLEMVVEARPLAFDDLRPFVPGLPAGRTARFTARLRGGLADLAVDVDAAFSDGATLAVEGHVQPGLGATPIRLDLEGVVRRLDPAFFTGADDATPLLLSADFRTALAGDSLAALGGTLHAEVYDAVVGRYALARSVLDATFDDGRARVDLQTGLGRARLALAGTLRPFDAMPTYDLEGRLRRLDVGAFTQGGAQQSDVNGTFTLRGRGFDPQTADAQFDLELASSTINRYRLESGRLRLTLADGDLDYGTRLLFPEGFITATGEVVFGRPGTDAPLRFTAERGRIQNFDVAALLGRPEASSVNANFSLQGRGADPKTMDVRGAFDLYDTVYGPHTIVAADLDARLDGGLLTLNAKADLVEAGAFDLALRTRPFDATPLLNITDASFRGLDLGRLTQNPDLATNLNGRAQFSVRHFDPRRMRLEGTFALDRSTVNDQTIDGARVTAQLRSGTLDFNGRLDLPEGSAQLAGTARPFLDVPTYTIDDGTFQNINLAAFTGNPRLRSSLNGSLRLDGRGFDPQTLTLEGRVSLEQARLNDQAIDAATLAGTWRDGTLDFDLLLDVPQGRTTLVGTARPLDDLPTYRVTDGTFAGLNIGALTGNPDWQTNLNGRVEALEGQGFDPQTLRVTADLLFDRSTINNATLLDGRLQVAFADGQTNVGGRLGFEDGAAQFTAEGRFFDAVPTYRAEGTLRRVDLGRFLPTDTLQARFSARFDVEGRGFDPQTMALSGTVSSGEAFYEGATVDTLFARFDYADGLLRADTLLLRSTVADLRGGGRLAVYDPDGRHASDFRFSADVKDLAPVRDFLQADLLQTEGGHLEGRLYGRAGTLRFDAQADLRSFVYNGARLANFQGRLAGEFGPDRKLTLAEADGDIGQLTLGGILVENTRFDFDLAADVLRFSADVRVDRRRQAHVSGAVDLHPERRMMTLEAFTLSFDGDQWQLLQEATITYGDQYRVSGLLLYTDDQQIALDGVIDPDGEQNMVLTVESFKIETVAELLGYRGLAGRMDGSMVLSGPAAAPDFVGDLRLDLSSFSEDVGDLRLGLDYDDRRLGIDALLTHDDGSTMKADGFIPLDLRLDRRGDGPVVASSRANGDVDIQIVADAFDVGWIQPFLDPETYSRFDGRLTGAVDVAGTLANPLLDGQARFVDGAVGLAAFGVTYHDIRADLTLQGSTVQVQQATLESGNGTLTARGAITLAELTLGEFDLDLRADAFLAVDNAAYRAFINGTFQLDGTTRRPVLNGNLELINSDIFLTEETTAADLEVVELSPQDLRLVEERFGIRITEDDTTTFDFYNALAMDLDVRIGRNVWLRARTRPSMDIQFNGTLDVMKRPLADAQLFGTIEVEPSRSRITQFGKRFELTSGTLSFNGPVNDPFINIQAEYEVPRSAGIKITLDVTGRLDNLEPKLGSTPSLTQVDIVSYLATGRPASQGLQLDATGANLALDQVTAFIEGVAGSELGLDVVEVQLDGAGNTVITAGEYVTSRLFLSYSQPLSFSDASNPSLSEKDQSARIITIEYELFDWLLSRAILRGHDLQLTFLWEHSY